MKKQTPHIPAHPGLRQRADAILDALLNAPKPETYAEIIRAARAVLVVDKMLRQLWPADEMEDAGEAQPDEATAVTRPAPLNRQQRRAKAARERVAALTTAPVYGRSGAAP